MRPTALSALLLATALLACARHGGRAGVYSIAASPAYEMASGESYTAIQENTLVAVADAPRSTFAIDVDTASMSNVRRFLESGTLPPADAVRVEEMVNYFDYAYPDPVDGPFAVVTEVGPSPFHSGRKLVHIGLQGKRIAEQDLPPVNLVFLIDVSGSMMDGNKLPLLQAAMPMLVDRLDADDRVALVTYAGEAGVALAPTPGDQKDAIVGAIKGLGAGGSTNGAGGIRAAYELARAQFRPGGVNRVILATDGDFNVGVSDEDELVRIIERERQSGVELSVIGVGTGNLKDSRMEKLADHGNGNYAYFDGIAEARKVLVEEMGGTLVTIAKDVKVQVELDPAQVESYRLLGYENRLLAEQDFRNDARDAGELGAGHSVTAIYEIVPAATATPGATLATVRLRWQPPGGGVAAEMAIPAVDGAPTPSDDFRFSAAVAGFGMLLRNSDHRGDATWTTIRDLARASTRGDSRRLHLVTLIETAARLAGADLGPSLAR